jgi:Lrp/AsnC family leucine-responsive transcriptional regulator
LIPLIAVSCASCSKKAASPTATWPNGSAYPPPPACAGVIRGYRADIDRTKVGLGLTVIVGIKADGHHAESAGVIQRTFLEMPEVVSCQLVSGEADFLLEVVVPDLSGYERFLLGDLLTMPMVKDVHSSFVIRTVKDQGPFPIPD